MTCASARISINGGVMSFQKTDHNRRPATLLAICLMFGVTLFWWGDSEATTETGGQQGNAVNKLKPLHISFQFQGKWEQRFDLKRGETFDVSVSLPRPSALPEHGRV